MGHALIIFISDDSRHLVVELQMDDNSPWTMVKEGKIQTYDHSIGRFWDYLPPIKGPSYKCSESSEDGPSI